jgi:hypothetical protein
MVGKHALAPLPPMAGPGHAIGRITVEVAARHCPSEHGADILEAPRRLDRRAARQHRISDAV